MPDSGAVTPAREMLAELLLLEKKRQESLTAYEAVLKVGAQPVQRSLTAPPAL